MRGIKGKDGSYNCGVMRSPSASPAPRLKFGATTYERKVDLRQFCSPIFDQEKIGSCCACSLVGALEFLVNKNNQAKRKLSPMFLFYNARKMSDSTNQIDGTMTAHANAAVMAFGVCDEDLWPYREEIARQAPSQTAYNEATNFEAVQYARLGSTDEVKAALSGGLPVMFAADIGMGYFDVAARTGRMPAMGTIEGGKPCAHAMLLVGYDEDDRTWLVRNSWGEQFGEKGYLRIPYDLFNRHVWNDDLWVIGKLEDKQGLVRLEGSVHEAQTYVEKHGADDMRAALAKLGKDIGADLQKRVDDSKMSIRERLRKQEDELAAKRKKPGEA